MIILKKNNEAVESQVLLVIKIKFSHESPDFEFDISDSKIRDSKFEIHYLILCISTVSWRHQTVSNKDQIYILLPKNNCYFIPV